METQAQEWAAQAKGTLLMVAAITVMAVVGILFAPMWKRIEVRYPRQVKMAARWFWNLLPLYVIAMLYLIFR